MDYRFHVSLAVRSSGAPDPTVIFPGILVPNGICELIRRTPTVLQSLNLPPTSSPEARKSFVRDVCSLELQRLAQAIEQSLNPRYVPFDVHAIPDVAMEESDYNVGTPDKPIWKKYAEGLGITLFLGAPLPPAPGAAAPQPPYPVAQTLQGVSVVWLAHCRLEPLG